VVFELSPGTNGSWNFKVLYSFTGGADGGTPDFGSLILDTAGKCVWDHWPRRRSVLQRTLWLRNGVRIDTERWRGMDRDRAVLVYWR
jgi:hypothetical protein